MSKESHSLLNRTISRRGFLLGAGAVAGASLLLPREAHASGNNTQKHENEINRIRNESGSLNVHGDIEARLVAAGLILPQEAQASQSGLETQRDNAINRIRDEFGVICVPGENLRADATYFPVIWNAFDLYRKEGITNFQNQVPGKLPTPLQMKVSDTGENIQRVKIFGNKTNSYYVNYHGIPQIIMHCPENGIESPEVILDTALHEIGHAVGGNRDESIEDLSQMGRNLLNRAHQSILRIGYSYNATSLELRTRAPWDIPQTYRGWDDLTRDPQTNLEFQFNYILKSDNFIMEAYAVSLAAYIKNKYEFSRSPYLNHYRWAEEEINILRQLQTLSKSLPMDRENKVNKVHILSKILPFTRRNKDNNLKAA